VGVGKAKKGTENGGGGGNGIPEGARSPGSLLDKKVAGGYRQREKLFDSSMEVSPPRRKGVWWTLSVTYKRRIRERSNLLLQEGLAQSVEEKQVYQKKREERPANTGGSNLG